jgi:hypothetical protein
MRKSNRQRKREREQNLKEWARLLLNSIPTRTQKFTKDMLKKEQSDWYNIKYCNE